MVCVVDCSLCFRSALLPPTWADESDVFHNKYIQSTYLLSNPRPIASFHVAPHSLKPPNSQKFNTQRVFQGGVIEQLCSENT